VAGWASGLLLVYLALAFGVRVAVARRTTGGTGIVPLRGAPAMEILAGGLLATAIGMGGANPFLVLGDVLEPIDDLDGTGLHALGLVLCAIGIGGTFLAQMAMGASWRIGVDAEERTELITGGLFALCRNPIYTFMLIAWAGFALLVPTWLSIASVPAVIVALEIQVRLVEEPFLIRSHGDAYRAYAARVGRFVPGFGRLT
jgi:protein-S-isoprenylcysteine O-methyltransferase Ste14